MDCSLFGSCRATAYHVGVLDNFYSTYFRSKYFRPPEIATVPGISLKGNFT